MVVSARHIHTRKAATLKILAAFTGEQVAAIDAQVKKARKASRLRNEHVARIVEIGTTEDGMRFIATEALKGVTVEQELDTRGRFLPDEAVRFVLQACEALAEAHAIGIVHGNVKPRNLLLATTGEPPDEKRALKVLDFGMASPIEAIGDASASAWFGSPAYLAPEQIQTPSAVDARADIWALGVVLYQMIKGEIPFAADTVSGMIVSVVMDTPALLTDVPYQLARVVGTCLEKDPARRFASVEELAAALVPFAGEEGRRLSERVKIAASTPPPSDPLAIGPEGTPDDSMPPVSMNASRPPRRPLRWDVTTSPSRRVEERRRRRLTQVVMASAAASATIVIAAALGLSGEDEPGVTTTTSAVSTPAAVLAPSPTPGIPRVVPRASSAPAPAELDAPDGEPDVLPSPQALPPAPRITMLRPPPPPPPPREPVATSPKRHRAPDQPPPSRPQGLPPATVPQRGDESYFRQLFNERK
jgi:serine/threonine protein kinase